MTNDLPDEIILNGVNASENSPNRGRYLLTLQPDDLQRMALGQRYSPEHYKELKERERLRVKAAALETLQYGRDDNNLAQAGWGVIFADKADPQWLAAVKEALGELFTWRSEQAGELYRICEGEWGYQPGDTADTFMRRYRASPGTVDPTKLPYYLLIVGNVDQIPYRFQYELDTTYLVGRIYFDTLEEYAHYAHSVVTAEKNPLRLPRRAVFFGTRHDDDRATAMSADMLVAPLARQVRQQKPGWQVDHLAPADSTKARLGRLMGDGETPALLFTASHGVGFDRGDPQQLPFQGALLCQDLEAIDHSIARRHYLGAEDIADNFQLHGLVGFHFACYGVGTPKLDSFTRADRKKPLSIAPHDFLAALPRRLLSHPNGGALAIIGHVDRAWSYSFKWGEATQQTQTFQDTLLRLMDGHRAGLALDQFNMRYAQIAVRLTNVLDPNEAESLELSSLAGLWTANNDARGYALLGDPAVSLPVARGDDAANERAAQTPIIVRRTPAPDPAIAPAPAIVLDPAIAPGETRPVEQTGGSDEALRRQLQRNIRTLANQLDGFADELGVATYSSSFEEEDFGVFDRESWENLGRKLRETMATIGDRLEEFAGNVTSLEVRTYASEQIADEKWENGRFSSASQRALTRVSLDGDTQIVIPTTAGDVDEVIWDIHMRAVEQAQANRVAMLKAVGEMLVGLIPTSK